MTKIGVGVGEEFPIEDKPERPAGGGPEQGSANHRRDAGCGWGHGSDSYEDWRDRRDDWRARRSEWRARRREWRRRYRDEMRMHYGPGDPYYFYWGLPRILRIVIVIAAIMLVFRLIADAPFIILGMGLLAVLYIAHRHREEEAQYRHDAPPPPPPSGGH